jgi:hypothetical protein
VDVPVLVVTIRGLAREFVREQPSLDGDVASRPTDNPIGISHDSARHGFRRSVMTYLKLQMFAVALACSLAAAGCSRDNRDNEADESADVAQQDAAQSADVAEMEADQAARSAGEAADAAADAAGAAASAAGATAADATADAGAAIQEGADQAEDEAADALDAAGDEAKETAGEMRENE